MEPKRYRQFTRLFSRSAKSSLGTRLLVKDHHQPPPSTIVQQFKFNTRIQRQGETVSEFVADLCRISEYCKFEATLEDMLRDRLVCSIQDRRLQQRLLSEADLTFIKGPGHLSIHRGCRTELKRPTVQACSPSTYKTAKVSTDKYPHQAMLQMWRSTSVSRVPLQRG